MTPARASRLSRSRRRPARPRERATAPRYYFDWERRARRQAKPDAPFTPAVSLFSGLDVALGLLLEEGLEAAFERHARLGRACREGVKAMGLELFSPDEDRSAVVTAIRVARGRRRRASSCSTLRDRFGDHDRRRPGRAEGEDLPHRPHRLVRRLRHHDGARGASSSSLAEPGADVERGVAVTARARGVRTSTVPREGPRPRDDRRGRRRAPARALRRRRRRRRRPRRDDRRLRRDRHPLGDEAHRRPDRARRRG